MAGLIGGSIGFGLPIILRLELALLGFILCSAIIMLDAFFFISSILRLLLLFFLLANNSFPSSINSIGEIFAYISIIYIDVLFSFIHHAIV